jgi:hypothetical protein
MLGQDEHPAQREHSTHLTQRRCEDLRGSQQWKPLESFAALER